MANKPISMLQIRRMLQFLQSGHSQRFISEELSISRNTIKTYLEKIIQSGKKMMSFLYWEIMNFNEFSINKMLTGRTIFGINTLKSDCRITSKNWAG